MALFNRVAITVVFLVIISLYFYHVQADDIADLQTQKRFFAEELQSCIRGRWSNVFQMKLNFLDKNTTCNDGTPAGYYIKKSPGSKRWLVYLEGGWFCTDRQSCYERATSPMHTLMTSRHWKKTKTGTGILSSSPSENPSWWDANHVLIPYCSSDAWSGNVSSHESGEKLSFHGLRIIDKVIEDLLPQGLYQAKHLLLAGSSAGAIGVLLNVDRVSSKLQSLGYDINVRGLVDSGWYLNQCNVTKKDGTGKGSCGPADTIKRGMQYWRGVVPEACAAKYPSEEWKCYFGNVVYPTLNSSMFIFQWLYDETQLALDGSGLLKSLKKITLREVMFMLALGKDLKRSLRQLHVHSVFAPPCLYHTILTDSNWLKIKIRGYTLNDALTCWMSGHRSKTCHKNRAHHVSHCNFPQCNPTCPTPRDPYTGKAYGSFMLPGVPLNFNGNFRLDQGLQ